MMLNNLIEIKKRYIRPSLIKCHLEYYMSFDLFLKQVLIINKVSRSECIAKLNLYHKEFENLDTVTLSRWITGKTTPSLYKQLLICHYFNKNLFEFIKCKQFTSNNYGKNLNDKFSKLMHNIENSTFTLNYNCTKAHASSYSVEELEKNQYRKDFLNFYHHFDLYIKAHNFIDKDKIQLQSIVCKRIKNYQIVSHDSMTLIDKSKHAFIENIFDIDLYCIDMRKDFWFVNIGFHNSMESYKTSFILLIYFMYMNKKMDFLSLIVGDESLLNLNDIGYQQVSNVFHDNGKKVYLTKCNIMRILSHPYIIHEVSYFLNKYKIGAFFNKKIKDKYFRR